MSWEGLKSSCMFLTHWGRWAQAAGLPSSSSPGFWFCSSSTFRLAAASCRWSAAAGFPWYSWSVSAESRCGSSSPSWLVCRSYVARCLVLASAGSGWGVGVSGTTAWPADRAAVSSCSHSAGTCCRPHSACCTSHKAPGILWAGEAADGKQGEL